MCEREPSPAELRQRLGENLTTLSRSAPSISALCRELGINRTQFNRYRSGESFPRPDVLWRICRHFKVDARILLEPVDAILASARGPFCHSELAGFLSAPERQVSEASLPTGIYRTVRTKAGADHAVSGLVRIYRKDGHAFLRGFEPRGTGELPGTMREFRGVLVAHWAGFVAITSRRNSTALSYTDMRPVPGETGLWSGHVHAAEHGDGDDAHGARAVLQYLGTVSPEVYAAARGAGPVPASALPNAVRARL
ncbi:helix-turn-helix domain-containing protein [Roseivivax sediminis]|uniref:Cro/C1-type HTH DNA-binding domain-containing protein n=1 Tax=Roseivivax sediminis TaxID=936889 RepID=A0A1I1WXU0_9RHOB|nr:helix-turn-helix transcriptional regulator [Roseivivax sediminis]SFD99947.1 Cro/C1-type HTH DNA-binding domain-containing protein [Roseivivax sediminis]